MTFHLGLLQVVMRTAVKVITAVYGNGLRRCLIATRATKSANCTLGMSTSSLLCPTWSHSSYLTGIPLISSTDVIKLS